MSQAPESVSARPDLAMVFAVAAPPLLAYNLSPSATLLNQLLAFFGWGLVLMALRAPVPQAWRAARWPLLALGLLALGVLASMAASLPATLGLSSLALLVAAALVLGAAAGAAEDEVFHAFASAMLLAGLASAAVGFVQVFAPAWTDGALVARTGYVGRAVGNLRQPNHLSSLLVWALIALVPLARSGRWFSLPLPRLLSALTGVVLVWAVVLTASRTGALGMLLLAVWGALDRRMPRVIRLGLLSTPLVYALCWWGMDLWAQQTAHTFGAAARLDAGGDISSSRFGIWRNTLALIAAHPWTGVGFGEFNFAWTLGVFPGRPVAFFDHTHNLPLQFMVELGLPASALLTALLLAGLVLAARRAWALTDDEAGLRARAAWMMVLLIGLHSLLEYPLWYAYFLLPTAWAWGHALSGPRAPGPARAPSWLPVGVAMLLATLLALQDYAKVVAVFSAGDGRSTLEQRIARGQGSLLFGHHADYAAVTVAETPSTEMPAFDRATHALLDTRLMIAWARALDELGQRDRARFLVERLREFRNPDAREFLGVCDAPPSPPPFQCEAPERVYTPADFTRPAAASR
ncbi:O-antigen ligase C-terminal domain-containing protein [Ideonella sp. 4Y11]|uniref:O-antigen ligase C-terminal domain-containing protein n=1 Tax=Ideonella aquatica TaxID=2824119 RepID=A0A941BII0_9BURK|nr:O-antigen ligase family protein [Ideonella aquatica]MBQ0961991.1 O-antigen ligase C-terminal domain-containing protein [Ideonella aquatica]